MADLSSVFQLILAQQEAEARKEERHQQTALTLLNMEMRETESTKSVLLKEYYDKKAEVAKTEEMYKKYEAIDPNFRSQAGVDIIKPIVEGNKVSMSAVLGNLDALTTRQAGLESGLTELESQGQKLRELQTEFWGLNKTLQPHEYYADPTDDVEQLQEYALKPVSEGGLGWETTAGIDYAYSQAHPDPQVVEDYALKRGEIAQAPMKTGALASYSLIQSMTQPKVEKDGTMVPIEPEDLTYIDPDTGEKKVPTDAIIAELQSMTGQADYDDFITSLYALEAIRPETGLEIRDILEQNKLTAKNFFNLERDYAGIKALENEMAGINIPKPENVYATFEAEMTNITDQETLFKAYREATDIIPDRQLHAKFFDIVEKQLGGVDAYPAYEAWLNPGGPPDPDIVRREPRTIGEKAMAIPAVKALGWTAKKVNDVLYNQAVDIYNLGAVPLNYLTYLLTGYNPGYSGRKFFEPALENVGLTGEDMEGFPWGFHDLAPAGGDIGGTPPGEWAKIEEALDKI